MAGHVGRVSPAAAETLETSRTVDFPSAEKCKYSVSRWRPCWQNHSHLFIPSSWDSYINNNAERRHRVLFFSRFIFFSFSHALVGSRGLRYKLRPHSQILFSSDWGCNASMRREIHICNFFHFFVGRDTWAEMTSFCGARLQREEVGAEMRHVTVTIWRVYVRPRLTCIWDDIRCN